MSPIESPVAAHLSGSLAAPAALQALRWRFPPPLNGKVVVRTIAPIALIWRLAVISPPPRPTSRRRPIEKLASWIARAAVICMVALVAACGGKETVCSRPDEPYLSAHDNQPLRVPGEMSQPNRAEALAVPQARAAGTRVERARCLDEPPSYFRSAGTVARSPEEVVASWAQAWANREADAVLALYSTGFAAPTQSTGAGAWLEQRREQVATGPVPDPLVESLQITPAGADRRVATFVQRFGANSLRKELTLVRESGSWRIVAENVTEVK